MNSKLIVIVFAFVVSGCQVSVRLGSDGTFVSRSHDPVVAPAPTAVTVATKAEADSAPVCPSVPAVAECPTAQPVVNAASDTQTSATPVNTPDANSVAAESQNAQPQSVQQQDAQAQNTQSQEQHSEQQAQSDQSATPDVAVDEKPSAPVETFDIEKYVEQSASCVQQRPCSLAPEETSSPTPKVVDEPKKAEPTKVAEQAKPLEAVVDRKAVAVESGIQRVDRKRSSPVRVDVPPDMPR
ncbi:MAG: hypothetical protein WCK82_13165 [Bacteroidota bacterium]